MLTPVHLFFIFQIFISIGTFYYQITIIVIVYHTLIHCFNFEIKPAALLYPMMLTFFFFGQIQLCEVSGIG